MSVTEELKRPTDDIVRGVLQQAIKPGHWYRKWWLIDAVNRHWRLQAGSDYRRPSWYQIKKVADAMCQDGVLTWRYLERGWFRAVQWAQQGTE